MTTTTATWNDLEVGTEGPSWEDGPLTVTDFVRYQGASGDMNPIHHDSEFASKAGFPKPFAVGMRQMGVLACWANFMVSTLGARLGNQTSYQFCPANASLGTPRGGRRTVPIRMPSPSTRALPSLTTRTTMCTPQADAHE